MVAERRLTIAQSTEETKVVMVGQGQVFVQEKDVVTAHSIEERKGQAATSEEPTKSVAGSEKDQEEVRLPASTAIDPNTVSIQDIKRYEALMKGKAVCAHSNAQTPRGAVESSASRKLLYRRHNWIANGEDEFGPMDLSFESAANLISLNIDLTFSCKDVSGLLIEKEVP